MENDYTLHIIDSDINIFTMKKDKSIILLDKENELSYEVLLNNILIKLFKKLIIYIHIMDMDNIMQSSPQSKHLLYDKWVFWAHLQD